MKNTTTHAESWNLFSSPCLISPWYIDCLQSCDSLPALLLPGHLHLVTLWSCPHLHPSGESLWSQWQKVDLHHPCFGMGYVHVCVHAYACWIMCCLFISSTPDVTPIQLSWLFLIQKSLILSHKAICTFNPLSLSLSLSLSYVQPSPFLLCWYQLLQDTSTTSSDTLLMKATPTTTKSRRESVHAWKAERDDFYRFTSWSCMHMFSLRCWLPSEKGMIFAFVGPMILILLVSRFWKFGLNCSS